ncbi:MULTISPECIES: NosD domain-containing protein [Haloferax]|nr:MULTISPECIES: NosD domain-containing protein [Haloferax]MDS0242008.1 right-handed parallel beta-helix repeat-containing protein [Haloferax sp. S2CR25]MDS0445129.1 right-handed parallel beta-helix repeat-containing protein [Haloferax sp. S2CR25-2]
MSTHITRRGALRGLGLAALPALAPGVSRARPTGTVLSGCASITESGRYYLDGDLDCLEIFADDVRVDGRGYAVVGETAISGSRVSIADIALTKGGRITDSSRVTIADSQVTGYPSDERQQLVIADSSRCAVTNTSFFIFESESVVLRRTTRTRFESCTLISPVVLTLVDSHRNEFVDCEFLTEDFPVRLVGSSRNLFRRNLADGGGPGFHLRDSHRNRFVENEVRIIIAGFELVGSDRNALRENVVTTGLSAHGVTLDDSHRNRLIRNDLCGVSQQPVVESGGSSRNTVRNASC